MQAASPAVEDDWKPVALSALAEYFFKKVRGHEHGANDFTPTGGTPARLLLMVGELATEK